jgi:hypothetical protein
VAKQTFCTDYHNKTKVRYPNKAIANQHAAQTSKHARIPLQSYKCWDCGGWHITSLPARFEKEVIPSAAKLRRKLAAYGAVIAAAQKRHEASEKKLAAERARAAEIRKAAEADHAAELAWIRRETDRIFGIGREHRD